MASGNDRVAGGCTKLICVIIADDISSMREQMAQAAAQGADMVECRLDYLTEVPDGDQLRELLCNSPVEIVVTCRPVRQGGLFDGDESIRLAVLDQAARLGAAYIDVEQEQERVSIDPQWPEAAIILSHHDFEKMPPDLDDIVARMDASAARVNKVAYAANSPEEAFRAFDVIRSSRKPVIALAMGECGLSSRILAKKFGAMGTFAALAGGAKSAPGQPTIDEFKSLYRWDSIGESTVLCGVIGSPIAHSMSPAIHNAAFDATGADAIYLPLLVHPGSDNFNRFLDAIVSRPWLNWRGLSVTIPHKENAMAYVGRDNCDPLACKIGAINTITIDSDGSMRGDNTDYAAAIDSLCDAMQITRNGLSGRAIAVLGAGGAARALVAALTHYKADVTVYNRTLRRAEELAGEFECDSAPLTDATAARVAAEVVINCTPLGMHPKTDASPLESIPPCVKVVFDTIYNPVETRLLRQGRDALCEVVSGLEMFVRQGAAQFELWTGLDAPRDTMREIVVAKLGG